MVWCNGSDRTAGKVIWVLQTGTWPRGHVRFQNRDATDLRWVNLYVAGSALYNSRTQRREYDRERRVKVPEMYRNGDLKKNFGIGIVEYAKMLDEQNGVCAICKHPETAIRHGKLKMLAVGHCHSSGANRELLCQDCNLAIGRMKDDPARLRVAADYLERHAGNVVPLRKESA